MITTTVVWPQMDGIENPSEEESVAMFAFRATLLTREDAANQLNTIEDTGTEKIAVRTWPSQETAQQWVDFLLEKYNVTSALVNT
jgi:hypothetical protein